MSRLNQAKIDYTHHSTTTIIANGTSFPAFFLVPFPTLSFGYFLKSFITTTRTILISLTGFLWLFSWHFNSFRCRYLSGCDSFSRCSTLWEQIFIAKSSILVRWQTKVIFRHVFNFGSHQKRVSMVNSIHLGYDVSQIESPTIFNGFVLP